MANRCESVQWIRARPFSMMAGMLSPGSDEQEWDADRRGHGRRRHRTRCLPPPARTCEAKLAPVRMLLRACATCLCLQLLAGTTAAQQPRIVVLSRQTMDGNAVTGTALDAAFTQGLQDAGLSVMELEATLRAQRFILAPQLEAGRVPDELSVLNTDALLSAHLHCETSTKGILRTAIRAYSCALDRSAVRIDTGAVLFAEHTPLTAHGLNGEMAVQSLMREAIPRAAATDAQRIADLFVGDANWQVELTVTHLQTRQDAGALATHLSELPEVSGTRLLVFNGGLAKYILSGHGVSTVEHLASAVEASSKLNLTVTHESARALHARFDLQRAYRRPVMMMVTVARDAGLDELGPEAVRTALINLPYLEMAHSRPLLTHPDNTHDLEQRLRARGRSLKVPLLFAATLSRGDGQWATTFKLLSIKSGVTIAASTASGTSSGETLDTATRALDEGFRSALSERALRAQLGIEAPPRTADLGLIINAFRLEDPTKPSERLRGTLVVRNRSDAVVSDAELQLHAAGRDVHRQALRPIAPGEVRRVPVFLPATSKEPQGRVQRVTARLTYPMGSSYERVSASAAYRAPHRTTTEEGDGLPADYLEVLQRAIADHARGEWEAAYQGFKQAQARFPNARCLRALGMVAYDLGRYREAVEHLRTALATDTVPLSPQQRDAAQALLRDAKARLAKY